MLSDYLALTFALRFNQKTGLRSVVPHPQLCIPLSASATPCHVALVLPAFSTSPSNTQGDNNCEG